jgi:hypothetical protein
MTPALKALAALALSTGLLSSASAALLSTASQVANLRIEGSAGFIGLSQPFAQPHGCGSGTRVWVDMNSPIGRATYASAMMAYAMKLPVNIRAWEESAKVFGECQFYDIVY